MDTRRSDDPIGCASPADPAAGAAAVAAVVAVLAEGAAGLGGQLVGRLFETLYWRYV